MRQRAFEIAHAEVWDEYRRWLDHLEAGARAGTSARAGTRRRLPRPRSHAAAFPRLHRQVCVHYALARGRGYSPGLVEALEQLVRRGHRLLYRRRPLSSAAALDFMTRHFPATLRRHHGVFWIAALVFYAPMIMMAFAVHQDPQLVYSLMDATQVADLEASYDPARRHPGRGPDRQADTDVAMFGFYIMNNIGIGFRTFAGGLLLGLGSLIILLFNALYIGAVAGYLTQLGYGSTFWPFVSGHGPFELTAIVICGTAGLLLGQALVAPGNRTRLAALREHAGDAVILVGGAAILLVLAAVIEAFWSATPAPAALKYGIGLAGWGLVGLYLARAGLRPHHAA
ncbi:hypothetical protein CKO25_00185 [Thiocapsa imhoffii]|uniref:Stage II sporulation protein M n=1 Tax=Thiocapsa imhoffii TaxID=382777 RepID=A0A9X1B6X5_9GAMM|nr:stage II sporulation protein M [Thiocapsa imhoffii]MBK1643097.1 hypothetical protein [Thiocapsa imhoffii]